MKIRLILALILILPFSLGMVIYVKKVNNQIDIKSSTENDWAIGIIHGNYPFDFSIKTLSDPVITAEDVSDVPATFVADPFLYFQKDKGYLFFEVFNGKTSQGDIGLAISDNYKDWHYEKIVIDEKYHLSYPYVFKYNNEIYLIPESAESDGLYLYKAINFPYTWIKVRKLLEGKFGDHGIIEYNKKWWLFVGAEPRLNNSLRLFYSDSLFGYFKEHKLSPVIKNNPSKARPGGRLIVYNNKVIRFAQNCKESYGKSLSVFQIDELTDTSYHETDMFRKPILYPSNSWTRHGMHHFDPHLVNGKLIASVDGYSRYLTLKFGY